MMKVRDIIRATAQATGMSVQDLLAPDRRIDVARRRQIGILISSRLTAASWPALGQYWGGRDHTTAMHAANRAEELIEFEDYETVRDLVTILGILGVEALPSDRPAPARRTLASRPGLAARIRVAESRLSALRAQLAAIEGDAR